MTKNANAAEEVTVPQPIVDEALYLLANVPWGAHGTWSRDGNTQAADTLQDWSDRRDAVIRELLRAPRVMLDD